MSDESIHQILESLPSSSMTTRLLGLLDYVVPGEWQNITSFEEMIRNVTGESDQGLIQAVGDRAIRLYNDPEQGYQRGVQIYRLLDDTSGLAGAAALADKLSESFDFLSFLGKVTPKADTTQAIDAAVKLLGELVAFCYVNGIPGDSVSDFAAAYANSAKEDAMRLAAFVAFDCVLPLGPDFMGKIVSYIDDLSSDTLAQNSRFAKIASYLPMGDAFRQKKLLLENLEATTGTITKFATEKGLEQGSILGKVSSLIGGIDHKLDYVAAAIDVVSNHMEHTGIQSVSRRLISRAYGEI